MKKFKYPLLITGSKEETDEIVTELEKLGYYTTHSNFESQHSIVTCFGGVEDQYVKVVDIDGWEFINGHSDCSRTVVSASNPELVLALAAMVDADEFYVGETLVPNKNFHLSAEYHRAFTITGIEGYQVYTTLSPPYDWINIHWLTKTPQYRKATKEEIIAHFNKQPMEKKIIGYKLKPETDKNALSAITGLNKFGLYELETNADRYSDIISDLKSLKILDILLEPVYEPEKPKVEIVTLRCQDGSFRVEVSKAGIYYRDDSRFLGVDPLRQLLDSTRVSGYVFLASHIDSGCKKQVPREDWEKVLSVYDNFQK